MKKILMFFLIIYGIKASEEKAYYELTKQYNLNKKEQIKIWNLSNEAKEVFGIDRTLLWAIIASESSFRNVSNGKSIGYPQIRLITAKDVYKRYEKEFKLLKIEEPKNNNDLKSPEVQICIASAQLNYLSKKFKGNKIKVLRAYNAGTKGMYKVNNLWYAKKVIKKQKEIKKLAEK